MITIDRFHCIGVAVQNVHTYKCFMQTYMYNDPIILYTASMCIFRIHFDVHYYIFITNLSERTLPSAAVISLPISIAYCNNKITQQQQDNTQSNNSSTTNMHAV